MEENKIPVESFMSAEINEIAAALSEFQGSVEQPKLEKEVKVKTKTGRDYSFKYADLSACVKAAAPALKANGLSVTQIVFAGKLITLLTHKSGQWFRSELYLPVQSGDYQSLGSAITYLKRYSYCAILGLVADTDDDGNLACGNQAQSTSGVNNQILTAATLKQAVGEMMAVTTEEDFHKVWAKWEHDCPPIVTNGTDFYKAATKIYQLVKQQ
ncbi:MAG: hypothetical protein HDS83_03410 [Bacteroidales bacterium]|nr:hypothetical protein [Bacteroidales bacterium]